MDDIFVNVNDLPFYSEEADGTTLLNSGAINIGEGTQVMRADQSGLWLGAADFANAPFKVDMTGAMTATSVTITGYVEDVGGQYDSAASGARVRILPDANTGIQIVDATSTNVFLAEVGGTNVGDITIGDYSGGTGILWDNSASNLTIKGDMTAGNISGVTITGSNISTGTTGTRVSMSANGDTISIYDSGNDLGFEISLQGSGFARIKTDDNRALRITADNMTDDIGLLYVGGDGAYWEYYTEDTSGANAWFDFHGYSSWFYVVDDFEVLDDSGGGTGGNLLIEGEFEMDDKAIIGAERIMFTEKTSDITGSQTNARGALYYYDDGASNNYWRSNNNGTVYQFDQHTP
jgi:hypothetical protein